MLRQRENIIYWHGNIIANHCLCNTLAEEFAGQKLWLNLDVLLKILQNTTAELKIETEPRIAAPRRNNCGTGIQDLQSKSWIVT